MLGVAELRYETAATLMLRGHLDKNKPEHRALLRSSRDPSECWGGGWVGWQAVGGRGKGRGTGGRVGGWVGKQGGWAGACCLLKCTVELQGAVTIFLLWRMLVGVRIRGTDRMYACRQAQGCTYLCAPCTDGPCWA